MLIFNMKNNHKKHGEFDVLKPRQFYGVFSAATASGDSFTFPASIS